MLYNEDTKCKIYNLFKRGYTDKDVLNELGSLVNKEMVQQYRNVYNPNYTNGRLNKNLLNAISNGLSEFKSFIEIAEQYKLPLQDLIQYCTDYGLPIMEGISDRDTDLIENVCPELEKRVKGFFYEGYISYDILKLIPTKMDVLKQILTEKFKCDVITYCNEMEKKINQFPPNTPYDTIADKLGISIRQFLHIKCNSTSFVENRFHVEEINDRIVNMMCNRVRHDKIATALCMSHDKFLYYVNTYNLKNKATNQTYSKFSEHMLINNQVDANSTVEPPKVCKPVTKPTVQVNVPFVRVDVNSGVNCNFADRIANRVNLSNITQKTENYLFTLVKNKKLTLVRDNYKTEYKTSFENASTREDKLLSIIKKLSIENYILKNK